MKTFVSAGYEVHEYDLMGEGLPVTQAGADEYARRQWKGSKRERRNRQLDACYGRGVYAAKATN